MKDGTRQYFSEDKVYGTGTSEVTDDYSMTLPEGVSRLWLVVSPALKTYYQHQWDEKMAGDDMWPYRVKFEGTDIGEHATVYAEATLDGRDIADATFTYDVTFPRDAQQYSGTTVSISGQAAATLGTAFQMQPTSINSRMQGWSASGPGNRRIMFYAVNPDGSLAQSGSTANGYGHWFDQTATVNAYANGYVFSEFSPSSLVFSLGQYPGKNANGSKYTISQALVYKNGSKTATARFIFNITIGGDVNVTLRSIDYTDPSTVGIQNVENVDRRVENIGIYDLSGRRISVSSASSSLSDLPKGVYIVNGRKIVVK